MYAESSSNAVYHGIYSPSIMRYSQQVWQNMMREKARVLWLTKYIYMIVIF